MTFHRTFVILMLILLNAEVALADGVPPAEGIPSQPAPESPAVIFWRECALFAPPAGTWGPSDFAAKTERPHTLEELMRNLQIALDYTLPTNPSLYQSDTLLRFFNGTTLTWGAPDPEQHPSNGLISATVRAASFPGLEIKANSSCWTVEVPPPPDGGAKTKVLETVGTFVLHFQRGFAPQVGLIREVFGKETQVNLDTGVSLHGVTYQRTDKGSVEYAQWTPSATGYTYRFQVYVNLDPPETPPAFPPKREAINDEDTVDFLTLQVSRSCRLEPASNDPREHLPWKSCLASP